MSNFQYNETTKNILKIFGDLFNDIKVARRYDNGTIKYVKVPITYSAGEKSIVRQAQQPDFDKIQPQITFPRLAYDILSDTIDDEIKLNRNQKITLTDVNTGEMLSIPPPVPYLLEIQLYFYSEYLNDALQLKELILSTFAPTVSIEAELNSKYSIVEELAFKLNSVTPQDEYEGPIEEKRVIIYTFDFQVRANYYKIPITDGSGNVSLIKDVTTKFIDNNEQQVSTLVVKVDPFDSNEQDDYSITTTVTNRYSFDDRYIVNPYLNIGYLQLENGGYVLLEDYNKLII